MVLIEGNLKIDLPIGVDGRKFDDPLAHNLSHCMKAVDFIVELEDKIYFIELKDPDHPLSKPNDRNEFIKKFLNSQLDADLKIKYRDSYLFEYAAGRATKPIYYLILMASSALSSAELISRTDALKRILPVGLMGSGWKKAIVAGCAVMNIESWNRQMPNYTAARM